MISSASASSGRNHEIQTEVLLWRARVYSSIRVITPPQPFAAGFLLESWHPRKSCSRLGIVGRGSCPSQSTFWRKKIRTREEPDLEGPSERRALP
ncbi:hypothetical protein CEXT_370051 [Caerostris extrusa]|uniref:Uncharacterized protein n=1 Tax=Caerostris extrusa TaxID=172846 RepID=A0AAV4NEL9_CAEEX|nr:hypothetical protein CEXT_370051 [Caerostris extrusa]